ncbi:MAG TPA: AI-2E family transporter [Chitinophagaceae bacterium]|jgi:predicted PurR-regulated permease PerM
MQEPTDKNRDTATSKKVERSIWKICGTVALFIAVLWILKETFNVLLLVLAGILIAIYFHGTSKWINKKTKLPNRACMTISVAGTILALAALIYFAGARIQTQVAELSETLPGTIQNVKEKLGETYIGQKILDTATGSDAANKTSAFFETLFRSTFGILGDIYVVIFLGIFFTISPSLYVKGFLKLFPPKARVVSKHILGRIGFTLTKWITVKIFSMFEVTVFTWIGLSIIGVPMTFALSVIAGLLNFVPNFGPLVAMVPAVLVGLMKGFDIALLIAGLYILIQAIDGSVIVPALQQKLIRVPPAILIISQLFMGILSGGWGILLATPLLVILMIIIEETYLKKQETG